MPASPRVPRIMIVGGGFIGLRLAGRLMAEGCAVSVAGRDPHPPPGADCVPCDLARDGAGDWAQRLDGFDALVNCAGAMGARADYDNVHERGAIALFDGAVAAGIRRIVQISALGSAEGSTAYHRTKRAADDHLASLGPKIDWAILRPSLVVGRGGASTALFSALAALPVTPDIGGGRVQPIGVDDLVEAIWRLLQAPAPLALQLDAVGPEEMRVVDLVAALRRWLGFGPARRLRLPEWAIAAAASLGIGPVTRESRTMLAAGNVAPVAPFVATLGFTPQPLALALARQPATAADRLAARIAPFGGVMRGLLAVVWLAGGLVPLLLTPMAENVRVLDRLGLSGDAAVAAVWAGSLADIAVGLALLLRYRGAPLAGLALMGVYSLILSLNAPEMWSDPFGALVKNLAVLGLGTAFHGWMANRSGVLAARRVVNRNVELADWLFTTPAVIVQPVTGVWLAHLAGWSLTTPWLLASLILYVLVGACWLPVVAIQIAMRRIADVTPDGEELPPRYHRLAGWWFALGWPAFTGVIVIFWLMVAKPELAFLTGLSRWLGVVALF